MNFATTIWVGGMEKRMRQLQEEIDAERENAAGLTALLREWLSVAAYTGSGSYDLVEKTRRAIGRQT